MKARLVVVLVGMLWIPAWGAVYQCTSETGEVLFTDGGCPQGYSAEFVVADPLVAPREEALVGAQTRADPGTGIDVQRQRAAEAETARLKAELEAARLRTELDRERFRAMDRKLDALLEQSPSSYGYGGVVLLPAGIAAKPFPVCRGKRGQTPRVDCRPPIHARQPVGLTDDGPSCGIVGCTPGIMRPPPIRETR